MGLKTMAVTAAASPSSSTSTLAIMCWVDSNITSVSASQPHTSPTGPAVPPTEV